MSTELAVQESKPEAKLAEIRFSVTETTITETIAKFASLTINGIDDDEGFEIVNKARMECVHAREQIKREKLAATEEYRKETNKVNAQANVLLGMLEPCETRLKKLVDGVEAEKEKIRQQKLDVRHQMRKAKLAEIGGPHLPHIVRDWTDEAFNTFLAEATEFNRAKKEREDREAKIAEENRIEKERLDKIAAQQKADADALAERMAEFDKKEAEQKAAAEKLAADQKKIDEDRRLEMLRDSAVNDPMNLKGLSLEDLQERNRLFPQVKPEVSYGSNGMTNGVCGGGGAGVDTGIVSVGGGGSGSTAGASGFGGYRTGSRSGDLGKLTDFISIVTALDLPILSLQRDRSALFAAYKTFLMVLSNMSEEIEMSTHASVH